MNINFKVIDNSAIVKQRLRKKNADGGQKKGRGSYGSDTDMIGPQQLATLVWSLAKLNVRDTKTVLPVDSLGSFFLAFAFFFVSAWAQTVDKESTFL